MYEYEYVAFGEEPDELIDRSNAAHVLFLRPVRYEILASLAVNGTMTVRDLARLLDKDSGSVWVTVQSFIDQGVIYKIDKPGFRKYIALDRKYFAFEELRDLLLRLSKKYKITDAKSSGFRTSFPNRRSPREKRNGDPDKLFGTPNRTKLLTVMRRAGSLSRDQMVSICHMSITGAQKPMDALRECKIVTQTGRRGLRKPYYLNPKWFAHDELARLLDRIAHYEPFYEGQADCAVKDGSQDLAYWGENVVNFTAYRKAKQRKERRKKKLAS